MKRAQKLLEETESRLNKDEAQASKERVDEVEKQVEAFRERLKTPDWLIMPESKLMQKWDMVTINALLFTAVVTPYEVACLETELNVLFFINRMVDCIFIVDMGLSFCVAFRAPKKDGGAWVKDMKKIRWNYLKGWFPIDLLSILPFDILALPSVGALSGGLSILKIIRIIRLMRLLKLFRVLKASRIYKRWEARISIPYSYIELIRFTILLIVMGHWMACAWAIIAELEADFEKTWLGALADGYYHGNVPLPYQKYAAALYWSITTITSVGYGDITPTNAHEMQICTVFLLFGSILWAYIIGNACGIVSTLDVETIQHHQTMDQLNFFMKDQLIPIDDRLVLRAFFNQSKDLAKNENYKQLIDRMSPDLKAMVIKLRSKWLQNVPYFKDADIKFLVSLTHELQGRVFVPKEKVEWSNTLNSVSRGVASRKGKVCLQGSVWGEDFILESDDLKDKTAANALTYIEVLMLERDSLFDILELEAFHKEYDAVMKYRRNMAAARGILEAAKKIKAANGEAGFDPVAATRNALQTAAPPQNVSKPKMKNKSKGEADDGALDEYVQKSDKNFSKLKEKVEKAQAETERTMKELMQQVTFIAHTVDAIGQHVKSLEQKFDQGGAEDVSKRTVSSTAENAHVERSASNTSNVRLAPIGPGALPSMPDFPK